MSEAPAGVSAYLWNEILTLLPQSRRIALVGDSVLADLLESAIDDAMSGSASRASVLKVDCQQACEASADAARQFAKLTSWEPDALILCENGEKLRYLSALNRLTWKSYPRMVVFGSDHHDSNFRTARRLEESTGEVSHAVGYRYLKAHFYELLRHSKRRGLIGDVAELGVFRGGTLLLLEAILDDIAFDTPRLVGFDTWNGFPQRRCLLDMYNSPDYEFKEFHVLTDKLSSSRITLVRGDIVETVRELSSRRLLLTFIDTDNFTPASAALPVVAANTVPGGSIVFDHYYAEEAYNDALGDGVAAMEFFDQRSDFLNLSGTGVFLKL